jgi:cytochrome b6-f complex iron-sulfur subunit
MEKTDKGRRKFIRTLILIAISLPLLGKYLLPRVKRKRPLLRVPTKDIPANGALVFPEKRISLINKDREIFALGLTCTHLGCTVNATPLGFVCPCHGSVFGTGGEVLRGPADRPLQKLAAEEQGNDVLVLLNS